MKFSLDDHQYMARAIKLARQGWYTTSPNPRVGCVIVKDGKIVGEGFHKKAGEGHAEVNALAQAGTLSKGVTAYVTLEPCSHFGRTPPCAKALIEAQVTRVVVAMVDPNPQVAGRGVKLLQKANIQVDVGLLEQDAEQLNPGFITLMTTNKPFVRCKLAASLDGKTAMASGESKWITSSAARQDVQRLRAQSCAIISGADSIITDQARMSVRWNNLNDSLKAQYREEAVRQPVRVIIDSKNRLTPELALFSVESPVIILTASIENIHQWPHFVQQVEIPTTTEGYLDLSQVLNFLALQGLNDVLIESGRRLAGAFIEQNLVDELTLYQAPKLMGAEGLSLVDLPKVNQLSQAKILAIKEIKQLGDDIRITASFN